MSLKAARNSHYRRRRSSYKKGRKRKVMESVELEELPASFKSAVKEHFGFPVPQTVPPQTC